MTRSNPHFVFLFPGQGAQYVGMGQDFYDSFSEAKEVFEKADDLLKENLSKIIFQGPETLLTETRFSQLGIFVVSCAILRVLEKQMPDLLPDVCGGLSLGEYTAVFASKKANFETVLFLIQQRAALMHQACVKHPGAMSAVLGMDPKVLEELVHPIPDVWVANYNCPGQVVISGTKKGILEAEALLKKGGAKRVVSLPVHGAFHSGLMQEASDLFKPMLASLSLSSSKIDLLMNVPGQRVSSTEEILSHLILQMTSSVRWEQGIISLKDTGCWIEIGCGKTLTGFNRKIGVAGHSISIEKIADLDALAKKRSEWNNC